ncbi:hypothetical protein Q31a_43340 [Aureliella helgolandensis]|uniref:Uncharacterized protein n=1 Tax=Aureliella helgolandensis TaxID=2527968 RepID=A0A518GBJ7_9BACT|nr:hypothetical protein Q31a_43340 [Aureliella helgolandensis]
MTLGRKLVDELGLEPSVDTLGRWISHYVAELITRCETEDGEAKESAKQDCFHAILRLWRHRSELPSGKRPFEDMEPIVRAVASLDPEDETPRYFREMRPGKGSNAEESKVESWLELADGLDYSAKLLIGHCLTQAASLATDKSKEWVKDAMNAGRDDGPSEIVIKLVAPEDEFSTEPSLNQRVREQLEGRISRLKAFVNKAGALVEALELQLNSVSTIAEETPQPKS